MSYLQEFQAQIQKEDLSGVLHLWEEYCCSDDVNSEELIEILETLRTSDLAEQFGNYVELGLPLSKLIEDTEHTYKVLTLILDLQTTNSPQLAEVAFQTLKERYGEQKYFTEKMRLIGMRNRKEFRGALRNYDLLTHLDRGQFVFHTGGWGTGEVLDYSLVREELVLEFENVLGKKFFTFTNAFKQLIPLEKDNFLSRRFGDPDALEEEARKHPVRVIRMLLRDMGPKAAAELKEELCELVIPEKDWTKWWQSARSKLKKDTRVEIPSDIRQPFRLREADLSHGDRFKHALDKAGKSASKVIQTIYNFTRDFPEILKVNELREEIRGRIQAMLAEADLKGPRRIQLYFFQESFFAEDLNEVEMEEFIRSIDNVRALLDDVEIIAFKKRTLVAIQRTRSDWVNIFLELLLDIPQTPLRDYLLKELHSEKTRSQLEDQIHVLLDHPARYPESFVWYFQKIMSDSTLPFSDAAGRCKFFEEMLILFNILEQDVESREIVKKIYQILSAKRYQVVRDILEDTSETEARELLLLVTKCHTLSSHDIKIVHALAQVVHPGITGEEEESASDQFEDVIWTTQEGYEKLQAQIEHIGTVETVDNAKEIEEARALGDLRENSEYKFALERRSRLQGQLKLYTDQLSKSRILCPEDVNTEEVSVGTRIELEDTEGSVTQYTLLGPWDTDVERNILSFQSKLAKSMIGHRAGEEFTFQDKTFRVRKIQSIFDA